MTTHQQLIENIDAIVKLDSSMKTLLIDKNNAHNHIKHNPPIGLMGNTPEAKERRTEAKECIDNACSQLPHIEQDIFILRSGITHDSINQHLDSVTVIQVEIDGYKKLINEQQGIIDNADHDDDSINPLMVKRENVLTDIALGKAKTGALDKLDAEIEALRTELTAPSITTTQAQQLINGLERRLATSQETLDNLNTYTAKIIDAYLMAQATNGAYEFNAMLELLSEKLIELVALDGIVKQYGQRKNTALFYGEWEFKIPFIAYDKPILGIETNNLLHHRVDSAGGIFEKAVMAKINQLKQQQLDSGLNHE